MNVSNSEYRVRRNRVISSMESNSLAILPAAPSQLRNRDTEYPFRQNSDFFYLTGLEEPEAILVLISNRSGGEAILFLKDRDPNQELWTGESLGIENATTTIGIEEVYPIDALHSTLPELLTGVDRIYVTLGEYSDFDQQFLSMINDIRLIESGGASAPETLVSFKKILHEQRLYKSNSEIGLMQRAADITTKAHLRAFERCQPGISETQLEAELIYEFMRHDARFAAYPSIVGSGKNACVMHYVRNDSILVDGELVLIDAGCEFHNYASDITRTIPINGRYSPEQKAIYEIVLDAQNRAIDSATVGSNFNTPHEIATEVLAQGLLDLGLLQGSLDEVLEEESFKRFTLHRTSHWLGLDVHDVGDYRIRGDWRPLEENMILTVEPGIYIPNTENYADIEERWRGIGIRIEDDVLIEKQGNRILSATLPKELEAIEALMN